MTYLAIDTATDFASVAVGEPGGLLAELVVTGRRHAAALGPAIQDALELAALDVTDLTGMIVADGPGSFTGLRIGFASAKGIIRVREHLTLAVAPSLMGAAWAARRFADGTVAALADAMRGEVFAAVYRFSSDEVETLLAPVRTRPERLATLCPESPRVAVGAGAVEHASLIRQWTGRPPVGPPEGAPRASALLDLLAVRGATRLVEDVDEFEPVYGRLAEAQVRWERKHGQSLPDPNRTRR